MTTKKTTKNPNKEIQDDLTYKIIGCSMKVHTFLGNGYKEVIYQRALALEMETQGINFLREMDVEIFYNKSQIGKRRVDFFLEDRIMLEIKAVTKFEDIHLTQTMNYCQAYNLPVGLLVNFGNKSLGYKRVYNINHPQNSKLPKNHQP